MLRADLLLLLRKYTPLHKAADSESVQLLITAKSNPNAEDHVIGLITANVIDLCGVELCGLLLQLEATALHTAVMEPRCTRLLWMDTLRQCSYFLLQRAIRMLRTG